MSDLTRLRQKRTRLHREMLQVSREVRALEEEQRMRAVHDRGAEDRLKTAREVLFKVGAIHTNTRSELTGAEFSLIRAFCKMRRDVQAKIAHALGLVAE